MKKLLTLFMALCLCFVTPLTTFAAEGGDIKVVENISAQEDVETLSAKEMTYNQAWIDAGKYSNGSFGVKNPHTFLFTKTKGTVNIESDNPNAQVNIVVHDGINVILNKTLRAGEEARFDSQSNSSEYVISYFVYSTNKKDGIRVNCWLY